MCSVVCLTTCAVLSCPVEDKKVFEFSDYFWGMIIDKAEVRRRLAVRECSLYLNKKFVYADTS